MDASEPPPRLCGFIGSVGGKLCLLGGAGESRRDTYVLSGRMYLFDPFIERWLSTSVEESPLLDWDSCNRSEGFLYGFSKADGMLWEAPLTTFRWRELQTSNSPMCRNQNAIALHGYKMVLLEEKLVVFGGWCTDYCPVQLTRSKCKFGFTNELHILDLNARTWLSPEVSGATPPPSAHFTFTDIGNSRAVMFGGFQPGHKDWKSSDLYLFNLGRKQWDKIERQGRESWPEGRTNHTALSFGLKGKNSQLLVIGGSDKNNVVLDDAWLLDLHVWRWSKILESCDVVERVDHCTAALEISDEVTEVFLFGGRRNKTLLAESAILRFELMEISKSWKLVNIADHTQLGIGDRVENKAARLTHVVQQQETQPPSKGVSDLHGFIAVGETTATYSGEPMDLSWNEYGIEMHIDKQDLPPGVSECPVTVSAAVSGEFDFPEDTEPASGVYKFDTPLVPKNPVKIKIQHCASEESIGYLSFASSSSDSPPYNYELIEGGNFTPSHGELEISEFFYYTILQRHGKEGLLSVYEKSYLVSLHSSKEPKGETPCRLSWSLFFSIIKNCAIFQKCMEMYFSNSTTDRPVEKLADVTVKFKNGAQDLELDINGDKVELQKGWTVCSLVPCMIEKSEVDSYIDGRPPHFRLLLLQNSDDRPGDLMHKFVFNGIEDNRNFIRICKPVAECKGNHMGPTHEAHYKRVVHRIDPSKHYILSQEIKSELHLNQIADKLICWEEKCYLFHLKSNPDVYDIHNGKYNSSPLLQRIEVLNRWKNREQVPTYGSLLEICIKGNFKDAAEEVVCAINES